ncbi:MAG: alginate export family protein, partial [Alteraurantiacibacter sp.]|nr:alginate export family protein [Alteraurantiacibacter sp.]
MKKGLLAATATVAVMIPAAPALAAPGDPLPVGEGLSLDPIADARLRYEGVDTPTLDADALTLRLRAGVEIKHVDGLSLLAEGEGALALEKHYNAFPFVIADSQRRPAFAVVADPMNLEFNRVQIQYRSQNAALTVGRQRINLDDQRFVGSVAWRQNEQTFDAVRGEVTLGHVNLDGTFSISQRTVFGMEAEERRAHDGQFGFLGASTRLGPVQIKAFSYLLDFSSKEQVGALATTLADTQTYGLRVISNLTIASTTRLNLTGSYARQTDFQSNPHDYGVDYLAAEATLTRGLVGATLGYELLGSDLSTTGVQRAFQTPLATLHKFNGWTDQFLATPAAGLE